MENTQGLGPVEMHAMEDAIVRGANRLEVTRLRRRHLTAGGIAIVLVVGVASAAFASPYMLPTPVAGPSPSATVTPTTEVSPTAAPTHPVEPPELAVSQQEFDRIPSEIDGPFDQASTRLVGVYEGISHFVARGTTAGQYCLILVPSPSPAGWAVGCGTLAGVRVSGPVVGESQLAMPGSAPHGWIDVDDFVSTNPAAERIPVEASDPTPPPTAEPYTVADVQAALDAIGPDAVADYDMTQPGFDPTVAQQNQTRGSQTSALTADAAARLGRPVALIRPTYVGLPDDASDSPNSLVWWVVTSEPTQFPFSYVQHVDGMDWTGWGQADKDPDALAQRLQTWLSQNQPGVDWAIVTQSH